MSTSSGSGDADIGFLVPVSDSPTLEATVEYAAREAREVAAETDGHVTLRLVVPVSQRGPPDTGDRDRALAVLEDATATASDALEMTDPEGGVDVETVVIELDRYLPDALEYVDELSALAADVDTVVVDPNHRMPFETPIGRSIEEELRDVGGFGLEVAPVERPATESRLVTRGGLAQFLTLGIVSFAFYALLGGFHEPVFDAVTGGATALLVAGVLSRITFERSPHPLRMIATAGRWLLYVPYLLWKIVTANLHIAYVVLHPSLPIDPSIQRFEPGVWGGMPTATLANSITLTPGTLTVDVREREFVVHALTESSRADLLEGGLERAVRFVFYGRGALRYPSPRERLGVGTGDDGESGANEDVTADGDRPADGGDGR